jgi:DNA-binding protein H-NS
MAIDSSKLNERQLTALMAKIQARLQELQLDKVARVRDKVIAMITSEGLDYAELMEHTAFARRKKVAGKRAKVAPKYRNPVDHSQTWSGRGSQPRWFKAALRKGKTERSLLIKWP